MTSRIVLLTRASSFSIWTLFTIGSAIAAPRQKQELALAQPAQQMNYYSAPAPTERLAAGASVQANTNFGRANQPKTYHQPQQQQPEQQQTQSYYSPIKAAVEAKSSRTSPKSSYHSTSAVSYSNPAAQTQPAINSTTNQQSSRYTGLEVVGKASWYGSDFHGGKTANGERYNMESLTAAHRTLPFGSQVKVTCLDTGRECVVRINNRGPYLKGRILDLSKAAARQIGMLGRGVGRVKMQVLSYGG